MNTKRFIPNDDEYLDRIAPTHAGKIDIELYLMGSIPEKKT